MTLVRVCPFHWYISPLSVPENTLSAEANPRQRIVCNSPERERERERNGKERERIREIQKHQTQQLHTVKYGVPFVSKLFTKLAASLLKFHTTKIPTVTSTVI